MVSDSVYKDLNKANKKLFKELVKLYDSKMYKKAFKIGDKIMNTQPNHSETLAMKALILNTVGRKKESYELINKAIMANFQSFTSWNIKGMIERTDKNFDSAKSCFVKSAEIESDNEKIYRDLLLLELQ